MRIRALIVDAEALGWLDYGYGGYGYDGVYYDNYSWY